METKDSTLTHWRRWDNPNYIGFYSLDPGKDLNVVIEKVVREKLTDSNGVEETKTVAHLKGQKPMILNKTNQKRIQKITGTPYIEEWTGVKITLYGTHIKAFGEEKVECLRIRPELPKKPELKPGTAKWKQAVGGLKGGTVTIEQIDTHYNITDTNRETLLNEAV